MTILDELIEFGGRERLRFETKDDNVFGLTIHSIIRYRNFLEIIHSRYQRLSGIFIEICRSSIELSKKHGNGPISPEMSALMMRMSNVGDELQLEIESFYQFAKILLDRVVNVLHFYFGEIQGISYRSHHSFFKTIEKFITGLKLKKTNSFAELGQTLQKIINDFRDDHIVHKSNPRDIHGIVWDASGKTQVSKTRIYPKQSDVQVTSENLDELLRQIDLYIKNVILLITHNQDRSTLNLKAKL